MNMKSFIFFLLLAATLYSTSAQYPVVLVVNEKKGWVHEANNIVMEFITTLGDERNWTLAIAEPLDAYFSNSAGLQRFDVIVFLLTSGPIFNEIHRQAFQKYVEQGGAVVGVHSALDTNLDWPFFTGLWGAAFASHPHIQPATMITNDGEHPTTFFMPPTWPIIEEYYNFQYPFEIGDKHVLLSVNESTFVGGFHGKQHPLSWTRNHLPAGSRVWVTALGHRTESYMGRTMDSRYFTYHLALGIEWAANGTANARLRWREMVGDLSA